jgi:ubiquinone/menaquinone biosynthesis C-methylase UbiE
MVKAPPRLTGVMERMDRLDLDEAELRDALRILARVNRLFGGTRAVMRHFTRLCHRVPGPIRVLDVGTGYADIPRAITRWARRRRQLIEITAVDRHARTLALAREACARYPEITLQEADALALPFAARSFDIVVTSQLLHHMEQDQPVRLLQELARVARRGVLVHDLRRGTCPYFWTRATLHIVSRSPVIRHDGPLSIRRGYLSKELASLATAAGWEAPHVRRHAFFRLVLVGVKS